MSTQRKAFFWTSTLSITFLIGLIPLYMYAKTEPIYEMLKTSIAGIMTGLVVSAVMSFVFYRIERNKYLKSVFDRAASCYMTLKNLNTYLDQAMNYYDRTEAMAMCIDNAIAVSYNAFQTSMDEPIYFEDYLPIVKHPNDRLSKFQQKLATILLILTQTRDMHIEIVTTKRNIPEGIEKQKANYLFGGVNELKIKASSLLKLLDANMQEFEKTIHINSNWAKVAKHIDTLLEEDKDKERNLWRQQNLKEANQLQSLSELIDMVGKFFQNNPEQLPLINELGLYIGKDFIPKKTQEDTNKTQEHTELPREEHAKKGGDKDA